MNGRRDVVEARALRNDVLPDPRSPTNSSIRGVWEIRCSRHSASNRSRPTRYSARFASIGRKSKGLPRNGGKSSTDAGPSAIIAHVSLGVHNIHVFSRINDAKLTYYWVFSDR